MKNRNKIGKYSLYSLEFYKMLRFKLNKRYHDQY